MTTKISTTNIQDTALTTLLGPKIASIVYPGTETATDTAGGETINLTGTDSVAYRPKKPLLRIEFSANEQNNFASLTLNSGSGVAQLPVISGAHLERSDLPRSDARTINRG